MINVDLNEIKYPAKLIEKYETDVKNNREAFAEALITGGKGVEPKTREESEKLAVKRFPKDKFNTVEEFEGSINQALDNWTYQEHFDKESKQVNTPWEIRKMLGKITNKVIR